jgi:Amt family ammonium transporter
MIFRSSVMGAFVACAFPAMALATDTIPVPDTGNTAWLLLCSALVMLMTPGLAFFYAGMVSRKNVVSTLLQNYVALAIVGLLWVTVGYSLAFSEGNPWIGGWDFVLLKDLSNSLYGDAKVPHYAFMAFQMMFAVITPALITGSFAERVHFKGWMLLLGLWSLAVYVPVAHWVWGPGGWLAAKGGLDFAGGLVVHITAGFSGLVAALVLGKRNTGGVASAPNDVPMIMLGAALLWFGWFGFNAGSAIAAGHLAAHAFVTTFVAAAASFLTWMLVDWLRNGKPSAVSAAIGLVVGLVAITPAAGYVSVGSALVIGAVAAVLCNLIAHYVKALTHLDDALEVFASHGMGGVIGALMTGLFASRAVNPAIATEGVLISGETSLFMANLLGVVTVCVYSAVVTFVLIKIVNAITPLRVSETQETEGLDTALHGEMAKFHDRRHLREVA